MNRHSSPLRFLNKMPPLSTLLGARSLDDILWIIDKKVLHHHSSLRRWVTQTSQVYMVDGGEELKSLDQFPTHIHGLMKKIGPRAHRRMTIIAIGGGSVGDFAGFVASIFKRGVELVHIPSTWLAAIDSAHGGKTGLNVGALKNQLGTFYPAAEIWIIKELLASQPQANTLDAYGELYKMSLLTKKPWGSQIQKKKNRATKNLWAYLPKAIEEKYSIVKKDPFEKKGLRQILNLGHTVGHVMELHEKIPHGRAVARGLYFCLLFSAHKGFLKQKDFEVWQEQSFFHFLKSTNGAPTPEKIFREILLQDKKKVSAKAHSIPFIFLKGQGRAHVLDCPVDEIVAFAKEQGFIAPTSRSANLRSANLRSSISHSTSLRPKKRRS